MSIPPDQFWRLTAESGALSPGECRKLTADFAQVKGAAVQGNSRTLAEWLIAQRMLTRYQAKILLKGRPGPFLFDDYLVRDRVGDRGSARFHAVHTPTGYPVVLQFLSGPTVEDPKQWAAVIQRVDRHARLVHPNLSRCYELVDLVTHKFLVTEDLPGEPVGERIARDGPMAPRTACLFVGQTALALDAMHGAGLVHGDVRPARLWIDRSGNARLWRDALVEPAGPNLDVPDADTLDRADFTAPEFARPGHSPDPADDVYSLGCVLYFLLSGRAPFVGGNARQTLARHANEPPPSLIGRDGIPSDVAQQVDHLMGKTAATRPASAAEVAGQMAQFVPGGQLEQRAGRPMAGEEPFWQAVLARHQELAPATPQDAAGKGGFFIDTSDNSPQIKGGASDQSAGKPGSPGRRMNRWWIWIVLIVVGISVLFAAGVGIAVWINSTPANDSAYAGPIVTVAQNRQDSRMRGRRAW